MSSEHDDGNEQAPEDDEDETDDVLDPRVKASCAANAWLSNLSSFYAS